MSLAEVLSGPIVRRVDRRQVAVWMATSAERPIEIEVFEVGRGVDGNGPGGLTWLGSGRARSVRVGERLWVHLAVARPSQPAGFPSDRLLAYDVVVGGSSPRRLSDLRAVEGPSAVTYGDLPLPTFTIQAPSTPLRLVHGSCRLLHGNGPDAFIAVDHLLSDTVTDIGRRPTALLLTGDQIYGDEVAGPLIGHLTSLGRQLVGEHDDASVPGVRSLARIPVYARQRIAGERAGFTSSKAGNHLLSLGEYLAAHVVAWDDASWPDRFPPADEVLPDGIPTSTRLRLGHRYATELACLETAREALPAARRVLANIPTYMCFDDHDVTDDWNLTREWRDTVQASPTGRRAVANALAAYWAFQGWGNQPDTFTDELIAGIAWDGDRPPDPDRFERTMWAFNCWSFSVPTHPPTIVLDTRTQRSFDSEDGAARLMSDAELDRVRRLCQEVGVEGETPGIFVSPVPVFGLELQERRQKYLAGKLGPYEIDFEAWHSNLQGLVDFMEILIEELGLRRCVILSGDVHYGLNVDARFAIGDNELKVAQLVSSSMKHSGSLARTLLNVLGRLVTAEHERMGWRSPPELGQATGLARLAGHLLRRPVNTDEWHDDAPVFLNGKVAGRVEADDRPEYREHRAYVAPKERPRFSVIGENNIGYLTLKDGGVVHRHLVQVAADRTKAYTAEMPWKWED